MSATKQYTVKRALFDLIMVCITGGLWLVYLIAKYLYTH